MKKSQKSDDRMGMETGAETADKVERLLVDYPEAAELYKRYVSEGKQHPTLLAHAGYKLCDSGVSPADLETYFEESGIDTNGVGHIRAYIDHEVADGKEELLAVCDEFREARSDQIETDNAQAGARIRAAAMGDVEVNAVRLDAKESAVESEQLSPGVGVKLWQLEVLSGDPSKSLAVRFRHGDVDMEAGGGRLENVPGNRDIGRVRDACAERGLRLVITRQEGVHVYARIVDGSVADDGLDAVEDCNMLTSPEAGLETCDPLDAPNFWVRSFGVATVDVSSSAHFKRYADAEEYVRQQQERGYRGWVMIQANFPHTGGTVRSPFVADIQVTDEGLEIQRNDRELEQVETPRGGVIEEKSPIFSPSPEVAEIQQDLQKWHVFGLGGLFRVMASSEYDAIQKATQSGLVSFSWACLAEKDASFSDDPDDEYIE